MWSFLENTFVYSEKKPLIFSSPLFWLLFGAVLLIYQVIYQQNFARNLFLFLFSLFFYYKAAGYFFLLIIFSTLVDYVIGNAIFKSKIQAKRTFLLVISLVVNLGLLAYFKYTYFFTDLFNQTFHTKNEASDILTDFLNQYVWGIHTNDITRIILPVGISFYTFQTLSYTLDIYRRKLNPVNNILDFAFYVSFFPQLVAGPIVRASDFIPQIYQKYKLSEAEYGRALYLIVNGLIKKILISDYISVNFVDRVFEDPTKYSGFENLMAVYGYAIQIYCDFSGYTDIAIGLALLLGFRLNINFNSPYVADSITDFWRRWHISLSSWLRDYLYISLGGNRSTSIFTYMSVPITLLIFLVLDGWTWFNFAFLMLIIGIWILSLLHPEKREIAYIGILGIFIFEIFLGLQQNWYSFSFLIPVLIFWVVILVTPKRKASVSTYINLMVTMLLGGLWHGADTRFVIWGALHGLALAVHKFWLDARGLKGKEVKGIRKFTGQLITFHFVCFCWIYFRAANVDIVNQMLRQLFFSFQPQLILQILAGHKEVFLIMLLGFIVHWIPRKIKDEGISYFISLPDFVKAIAIALIVVGLYQVRTADIQPFIYFQF